MSELSVLDLERETVELLPRREALTTRRGKNHKALAVNLAFVSIEQDANAEASGKGSEATAVNVAVVEIHQDADARA